MHPLIYLTLASARERDLRAAAQAGRASRSAHTPRRREAGGEAGRPVATVAAVLRPRNA